MMTFADYKKSHNDHGTDFDFYDLRDSYQEYFHDNVQVGDGVTIHLYTDAYAGTVIARTRDTLTIQRDKATRAPGFDPEWVPGGFSAICLNSDDQKWITEPDRTGKIYKAYWSKRKKGFFVKQCLRVSYGRHEYYDYNF